MPVYEQGYRRYEGELEGHAWRWAVVTATELRRHVRQKAVLALLALSCLPFVVYGFIAYSKVVVKDRGAAFPSEAATIEGLIGEFEPSFFVDMLRFQMFWVIVLTAVVGSGLIARDRETRALELFLSRPLTRRGYLIGKFGIAFALTLIVTAGPSLLLYAVVAVMQPSFDFVRETYSLPLRLAGAALFTSAVASMAILALSAALSRARVVGVVWFAAYLGSRIGANVAHEITGEPRVFAASLGHSFLRVTEWITGATPEQDFPVGLALGPLVALAILAAGVLAVRVRAVEVVKG